MKINPGDTVSYYFYFKDKNNRLIDPASYSFKVKDPSGQETAVTVTKVAVGTYEFNYTLADDAALGIWKILVHGELGAYKSNESITFKVEAL